MKRFLIAIVTLTSLCGWILTSPTRALPPHDTTTTHVVLPVYQYLGNSVPVLTLVQGDLDATFEATPQAGGWSIRAIFRSDGLTLTGGTNGTLTGRATGSLSVATGTTGTLTATRFGINGSHERMYVVCSLVVDADGVVTVQQYGLGFVTSGGSGHQGGGPCDFC